MENSLDPDKNKLKFGLIGYPLTHSFSRRFFTQKFSEEKTNAEYLNFELSEITQLPLIISANPELIGLNVTIPYKEQVLKYLDFIDDSAAEIKAVNTIKINRTGSQIKLSGFNTDIPGFQKSIEPLIQKHHKRALVLGTGGASKAVVYALKNLNIETLLISRNPKQEGEISYHDLDREIIENYKIIVNTTPVGTFPKIDECPELPYELLSSDHLLFDLVYNPELTEFLRKGQQQGALIKNGLEMLHLQALASWEIWNR